APTARRSTTRTASTTTTPAAAWGWATSRAVAMCSAPTTPPISTPATATTSLSEAGENAMKLRSKLLAGAALLLAPGGVASQATSGHADTRPTVTVNAQWDFHPSTLSQASSRAQQVVMAEVVSVSAGTDIVTPEANEPGGVDRIPTQRVTIRVIQSY